MELLLITGAGASRNLGRDVPMPLMSDWSDALCHALDERESNLASACHLTPGMQGPEFEKNLGLLLRWQQIRHLEERFQDLGGPQAGSHLGEVVKSRNRTGRRLEAVMETINITLYDQFGQRQVDDEKAMASYRALLRALGDPRVMLATTNYDRVGESALAGLGMDVDAGFRAQPERTPRLEPAGLIEERGEKTPVIHLHGAVGWYEQEDGSVGQYHADQRFNSSLGTPVVLYPDPDKDPTSDATVSELWTAFSAALEAAEAVMVVGHSLHDPALVRALRRLGKSKPLVITYFAEEDKTRVERLVPGAWAVQMDFGPEMEIEEPVGDFLKTFKRPARIHVN